MKQPTPSGRVVSRALPGTRRRDTLIAVAAGAAVLAFVLYAIFYFSREADSTGGVTGTILTKEFVPRPETQITFGQAGLSRRAIAGEYDFRVRVGGVNGRVYRVPVSAAAYGSYQAGNTFYFLLPPR